MDRLQLGVLAEEGVGPVRDHPAPASVRPAISERWTRPLAMAAPSLVSVACTTFR